ncbi:K+-transporting ATPase, c chain family protein [Mycobacterium kansasii]|uniref:K+-transporting ATPase, c chain family protein n=1 Tax=Mycobacterium kansasii TaxID=1768 RepID=A0A1V3XK97_MYCKA|nr:K+-transporting ATPase, c chain family protein [Mycobacterium kansasii]
MFGENYSLGQIVPIRGAAPEVPLVPADAVTASGSGLDPDISRPMPSCRFPG